jgi:hypothetical protein
LQVADDKAIPGRVLRDFGKPLAVAMILAVLSQRGCSCRRPLGVGLGAYVF